MARAVVVDVAAVAGCGSVRRIWHGRGCFWPVATRTVVALAGVAAATRRWMRRADGSRETQSAKEATLAY